MKKRDIVIAILIILFSLIVAWVINKSLSKGDFITTNLSLNDWLNFWGICLKQNFVSSTKNLTPRG